MHKHRINEMVCATHTTSYETDIETVSSPSSTSTPTHPNFQATFTSDPTTETLTPPSTLITPSVTPSTPPTALRRPPHTPLFCTTSTVRWVPVEAIVKHVEQITYSAGHTSFSYQILLPRGLTRNFQETRLETSAPPSPPPHTTVPTPSLPAQVPDVAPSTMLPSLPPPISRPQLPVPPTPAPCLSRPTFMPQTMLLTRPLPPSCLPVSSPK